MKPATARLLMTAAAVTLLSLGTAQAARAGGHGSHAAFRGEVFTGNVWLSFGTGHGHAHHGSRLLTRRHLGPARLLTRPRAAPRTIVIVPGHRGHHRFRHHGHAFGHEKFRHKGFGHKRFAHRHPGRARPGHRGLRRQGTAHMGRFQTFVGAGGRHAGGGRRH